MIRTET